MKSGRALCRFGEEERIDGWEGEGALTVKIHDGSKTSSTPLIFHS
jgi:hypothetical protein